MTSIGSVGANIYNKCILIRDGYYENFKNAIENYLSDDDCDFNVELIKYLFVPDAVLQSYKDLFSELFQTAFLREDVDVIKALLNHNTLKNIVDPNFHDYEKLTLLMYTALNGLDDIADKLLENEISQSSVQSSIQKPIANVDFKDFDGMTASMYAAANGNIHILSLLIENNANIHVQNNENRTLLMCAAAAKQFESLVYLLEKGAAANIVDAEGNAALIYAAASGNKDTVMKLLEYKANPLIKNLKNKSAADIAQAKGFNDIVAILKEAEETEKSQNIEKEKKKTTEKLATFSHEVMKEKPDSRDEIPDLSEKEISIIKNTELSKKEPVLTEFLLISTDTESRQLHPGTQEFYMVRKSSALEQREMKVFKIPL